MACHLRYGITQCYPPVTCVGWQVLQTSYCLTLDQLHGSWRNGREISGTAYTLASRGKIASQMMPLFSAFLLSGLFLRYFCSILILAHVKDVLATIFLLLQCSNLHAGSIVCFLCSKQHKLYHAPGCNLSNLHYCF